MKQYRVSEIQIYFNNFEDSEGHWDIFEVKSEVNSDLFYEVSLINENKCWGYQNLATFHSPVSISHILWQGVDIMLSDQSYSFNQIVSVNDPHSITGFLLQLFYTHAVRRQMIQLHASIIDTLGRGVVFLGPSGIGKTTQAERWAEYRSASIINGDIVFVQQTEEGFLGWGTPWHGSSPYCLNASVPVKALVVLKQAPYNALRELTGFEKVSEVSGSVFYPSWLEDGMELCTATLDRLLTQVPVYRLDNRADEEAVALLERELDRIS